MMRVRLERKWFLIAAMFWSFATIAYLFANVVVEREGFNAADAGQNVTLGLRLSNDGYFGLRNEPTGYHRREPFYPTIIAALNEARALWSGARLPVACGLPGKSPDPVCVAGVSRFKLANFIMLAGAGVAAGWLVLVASGSWLLAVAALITTSLSESLVISSSYFLTEVPAALLTVLSALFAWLSVMHGRVRDVVLLAVCLACLTLTKVIFAYLWIAYAAILWLSARVSDRTQLPARRRGWLLPLVLYTAVYIAIVGGWMTRNWLVSGHFELVEQRSFKVLSVRASYNQITWPEVGYGFVLHTPMLGEEALRSWGVPEAAYGRLHQHNEEGFRRLGQKAYAKRVGELFGDAIGVYDPEIEMPLTKLQAWDEATRQISQEARSRIAADPLGHLRASIAVGYRTLFPESGWGLACDVSKPRLAQDWGYDPPCPVWRFTATWSTFFNLGAFLALFALPMGLYLVGPPGAWLAGIAVVLPALYSHFTYAAASHFIVRYAVPEIPIRNVAVCLILALLVGAGANEARALLSRKRSAAAASPTSPKTDTTAGGAIGASGPQRSSRKIAGAALAVMLSGGLLWIGGRSMVDAIAGSAIWPQVVSVALGVGTYVLAARRWGAITDALAGRKVATHAEYLELRVATSALGYFLPRELAESGGRALWLTRFRHIKIGVATQGILIDRLGDISVTAIGLVPALALVAGWISAPVAMATTAGLVLAFGVFGAGPARPLMGSASRWLKAALGVLSSVPWIGNKLAALAAVAPIDVAVLRSSFVISAAKYVLLLARVALIGVAVGLPVDGVTLMTLYPLGQVGYAVGITPGGLGVFEAGWFALLRGLSEPGPVMAFLVLLRVNMILAVALLLIYTRLKIARCDEQGEFN